VHRQVRALAWATDCIAKLGKIWSTGAVSRIWSKVHSALTFQSAQMWASDLVTFSFRVPAATLLACASFQFISRALSCAMTVSDELC